MSTLVPSTNWASSASTRELELLASVEAAEVEYDLRAAVDDRDAVDREAVVR